MAKKVALLGMFTALGLLLGWLETLVPIYQMLPGMKIGLGNLAALLVLYRYGIKEAAGVNLLRILLSALLFGTPSMLLFGLSGGILSLTGMALLKKTDRFSPLLVSVSGAVLHNAGQLFVAVFFLQSGILLHLLPFLILTGGISGVLVGIAGAFLHRHLPKEIS